MIDKSRTTQSVVVTGGSAAGGIFGAPQFLHLLDTYFPDPRWEAWEPLLAVTIASFGGVIVDGIFRALGTAAAIVERDLKQGLDQ